MRSYVVVDVFTDEPLQGNPAAVFLGAAGLSDETMQRAARELNLSETVFLFEAEAEAEGEGEGEDRAAARARIFTPAAELPFAGHPLLGTAFVLGEQLGLETVRLQTGVGVIAIELRRERERVVFGEMRQPIPSWEPFQAADELLAALGVRRSGLPVEIYSNGPRHALVELEDGAAVSRLRPDLQALSQLGQLGVSCFAASSGQVKTRMFGPGLGVAEDPATGSAAGPLAVHLARHGRIRFGDRIEIHQGAEIGRPSVLFAQAHGTAEAIERVTVGGAAVIVARGEYRL